MTHIDTWLAIIQKSNLRNLVAISESDKDESKKCRCMISLTIEEAPEETPERKQVFLKC